MRARVLVLTVNDGNGPQSVVADAMTHGHLLEEWQEEAVHEASQEWGDFVKAHGFVDIEIPDDVIAQVLRRQADAGLVKAEAGTEVES